MEDYIEHLGYHYSDADQYLACNMCNVYKKISFYRFRNRRCRLCIYLHRYRYGHTRNQFREHIYKYNIREAVQQSCLVNHEQSSFANSPIGEVRDYALVV